MRSHDLRTLLDDVPDTFEIVLRRDRGSGPVLHAWRDAADEAAVAFEHWCDRPGDGIAYAAYRAAQDREDAAQDAFAHTQTSLTTVS